jgi:predicted transposase YdaD
MLTVSKTKTTQKQISFFLDPELLSYLTKSLVRLSTNHIQIIANETLQLRRLLANTSLNDDVRVRKINFFSSI